ncbi:hypothetical protein [Kitasatospora sp. NPDC090091]|uniref:hypothetical protein n=1 Tax=Kitasatospora sp. NPDC090091 TaxID=3364081 RepID=UPI003802009F
MTPRIPHTAADRLFDLLPLVHRMRDEAAGHPLRDLLRVIAEQMQVIEEDIARQYENWFVETAEDWVVPYLADLVGWTPVPDAGWTAAGLTGRDLARRSALAPRQDIANTLRHRRRKGTRALLEDLALDVAGLPGHAVEAYRLLARHQQLNHPQPDRGRTADLRAGTLLDRLGGPFDALAHTVDVRRPGSHRTTGLHNIPGVGLYVSRLRAYPVTHSQAGQVERVGRWAFTFDPAGFPLQLFGRGAGPGTGTGAGTGTGPGAGTGAPGAGPDGDRRRHPLEPADLPAPIDRRALGRLGRADPRYYGEGRSLVIHAPDWPRRGEGSPVPADRVIPADLGDWDAYRPLPGTVAVDPVLGRMLFPRRNPPRHVRVGYHYGRAADLGGGEYLRPLPEPPEADTYRVRAADLADPAALLAAVRAGDRPEAELIRRHWSGGDTPEVLTEALTEALNAALADEELFTLAHPDRPAPAGGPLLVANRGHLEELWPALIRPARWYRGVATAAEFQAALHDWKRDRPRFAVVEITRSEVLGVTAELSLGRHQHLLIRAARRTRPVLWLADRHADGPDSLAVRLAPGSRFTLDGLLVGGRSVHVAGRRPEHHGHGNPNGPGHHDHNGHNGHNDHGHGDHNDHGHGDHNGHGHGDRDGRGDGPGSPRTSCGDCGCGCAGECCPPTRVVIRHCTLVPGWAPGVPCDDDRPAPPSLELSALPGAEVEISHSVLGPVQVEAAPGPDRGEPLRLTVADSVLDATHRDQEAVGAGGPAPARAVLDIARTTVLGTVQVQAVERGENTVFTGRVKAARRSRGCLRFCWVPTGSRTPRRFHCQPDTALAALGDAPAPDLVAATERRLRPRFTSVRYPDAGYAQLAADCAEEIRAGADDGSELGVHHDLFLPQRLAALRTRLAEYVPAGLDAAVLLAD